MKLWRNNRAFETDNIMANPYFNKNDFSIPPQIKPLIKRLHLLRDSNEVTNVFRSAANEIESFKPLNELVYSYKGFVFCKMLRIIGDPAGENLRFVNDLGISCAPMLVDYIKVDDLAGIIVVFFPKGEHGLPIPYQEYESTFCPVSQESKTRFLNDINILLDKDKVHPFVMEGNSHWLVNPKDGAIILGNWGLLKDINKTKKESILLDIKEILSAESSRK